MVDRFQTANLLGIDDGANDAREAENVVRLNHFLWGNWHELHAVPFDGVDV